MKKHVILPLSISMLLLSSCSQSSEIESLQASYEEESSRAAELQQEVESYSAKEKEYLDSETEKVLDSFVSTWVTASFGDNSDCLLGTDSISVIVKNSYTDSTEDVSEMYDSVKDSLGTFVLMNFSDYTYMDIKFLDDANIPLMSYSFDVDDGVPSLSGIQVDSQRASSIINSLNSIGQ